jgi:hypothetical protein
MFSSKIWGNAELTAQEKYKEIADRICSIRYLPDSEGKKILDRIRMEQSEKALKAIEKEKIRLGIAFVEEKIDDFTMIRVEVGDGQVGIGALRLCGDDYCAACFMTPEDNAKIRWSNKKAMGLIGFRIMNLIVEDSDDDLVFNLPYRANPKQVLELAGHTLLAKAFKNDESVPAFFRRNVQRGEAFIIREKIGF